MFRLQRCEKLLVDVRVHRLRGLQVLSELLADFRFQEKIDNFRVRNTQFLPDTMIMIYALRSIELEQALSHNRQHRIG